MACYLTGGQVGLGGEQMTQTVFLFGIVVKSDGLSGSSAEKTQGTSSGQRAMSTCHSLQGTMF